MPSSPTSRSDGKDPPAAGPPVTGSPVKEPPSKKSQATGPQATGPQVTGPPLLFDMQLRQRRLARARKNFSAYDFLHQVIARDVIDRLESIKRGFPQALISGPGSHLITRSLTAACGVESPTEADDPLRPAADPCPDPALSPETGLFEEFSQVLQPGRYDLIISMMSLHHVNDMPGALIRLRRALKPDGVMIAALPAEATLAALKTALYESESALIGGVSPHISPFATIKDLGALLQRASFTLPVADIMRIPVDYKDPMQLLRDLRGMGETNILLSRKKSPLRRNILKDVCIRLLDTKTGSYPIGFEIAFLTGWAPHHSQPRPLRRGSATHSLEAEIRKFE